MIRSTTLLMVAAVALGLGCRSRGSEGDRCFPNGTCDEGLACLSDRCVALPLSDAGADGGGADSATSDAGSFCGNGVIDGTERCDAADLGAATCTSLGQGFTGGTLACDTACVFDISGCTIPPGCGDGSLEAPEQCDGGDSGGETCQTLGFAAGGLACALGCVFDSTGCWTCGDALIQPSETCDGTNTGGVTCTSLGFGAGTLSCSADCFSLDPSTCTGGPPTVPTPRKPINNTYMGSIYVTGSRRPTFTWDPSTVTGGASIDYDLQYSTSATFASGVTTATVTTTSYQPFADLAASMTVPVGSRYYWRVRACAMSVCSAYSPTRWVNVGRSDRDFNGDGYADLVIGAPLNASGSGAAYAYLGGPGGAASTPVLTILGTSLQVLGSAVASAGDLNGDGFSDLVVGANSNSGADPGHAYVYFGGAGAAFDDVPETTLTGEASSDHFGISVSGAGDVNADGFDDLVVGAFFHDGIAALDSGRAYLFLGGPGGSLDVTADASFDGATANDHFGNAVASAGDVNGDGYADIVIGAQNHASNTGAAYVFLGGPGPGVNTVADGTMMGEAINDTFGQVVSGAGDVDGDGFSDVLVGAPSADGAGTDRGRAYFFLGGPGTGFDIAPDMTLTGTMDLESYGATVCVADLNGDSYVDAAISSTDVGSGSTGTVRTYFGTSSGIDSTSDTTLIGPAGFSAFGTGLRGAGDVNGDGYDDLIVGAPSFMSVAGAAYVFLGGPGSSVDSVPDSTYAGVPSEALGQSVY